MINFKNIDKDNYLDVIDLKIDEVQKYFVADNMFSLVQSKYEDGLYTLAIYDDDMMIGFLLFDYDDSIKGWSLSRFMIDSKFQGNGYGKKSILSFFEYAKKNFNIDKLYVSVSVDNYVAMNMYHSLGFKDLKQISYTLKDHVYDEIQMVRNI